MQLTRRRLLQSASAAIAIGGVTLLAACQKASPQTTSSPTSVPPEPAATATSPAARTTVRVTAAAPTPAPSRLTTAVAVAPAVGKQMYQEDAQHTGRSPYAGPREASLLRRFDASAPGNLPSDAQVPRSDFQSSSAIGPDGTIYIANFAGELFALRDSPTAGDRLEVAWRFHPPAASSFHATPALSADGHTLYLGFASGGLNASPKATLYALQTPETGEDPRVSWSANLGATRVMASPTVGPDGTIYVANGSGTLFAVSPEGSVRWTAQTGPTVKSAPAIGLDGTIYHPTSDGNMYALSSRGQLQWKFSFGEHLGPTPLVTAQASGPGGGGGANGIGSGASPTVASDGTIFIGANNSNMYAVHPDGSLKWIFEAERELAGIWTTPVLSADGKTIYFGANKGGIYAVDAESGTKRWQVPVYGSIYASSVLDSRGVLYTAMTVEHVYALDSVGGEPIWDYDAHNPVWTAPSIRPDGTLVIADRGGLVQVIG